MRNRLLWLGEGVVKKCILTDINRKLFENPMVQTIPRSRSVQNSHTCSNLKLQNVKNYLDEFWTLFCLFTWDSILHPTARFLIFLVLGTTTLLYHTVCSKRDQQKLKIIMTNDPQKFFLLKPRNIFFLFCELSTDLKDQGDSCW